VTKAGGEGCCLDPMQPEEAEDAYVAAYALGHQRRPRATPEPIIVSADATVVGRPGAHPSCHELAAPLEAAVRHPSAHELPTGQARCMVHFQRMLRYSADERSRHP
jgi:hypothetical protein